MYAADTSGMFSLALALTNFCLIASGSRLRLEQESKPEVIWQKERDLLTKKIEWSAIQNEHEHAAKTATTAGINPSKMERRKQAVKADLDALQAEVNRLTDAWDNEKQQLNAVKAKKARLEQARSEMEAARRAGDFNKAAELLHGTIPAMERELLQLEPTMDTSKRMLADSVTAEAIASVIARNTGIPVSKITGADEADKLLHLEDFLRKIVVGQDHCLEAISNCVRLSRTHLQAVNRTLGNFLFLGPTGVGKTETAKALALALFENKGAMTRIDMSEYGERHTVSRLIGAPPGYVGYEEGGLLTESVRRRPYQVLLLDELEKAHKGMYSYTCDLYCSLRLWLVVNN
jgi:ATP-dependent Clp protease ATP-binding subunit ClpB